jgi:alpha-glucan phosphorylase-like protein
MPALKYKPPLTVAYFTMEIALGREIPTFAGGLGVLAADIMRSCSDLKVPAAFISICWQYGYLKQHIDLDGTQTYEDIRWDPSAYMQRLPEKVIVEIEGRPVTVGCWIFGCLSEEEVCVPVFFLDTNLPENRPEDRCITEHLYGGDGTMRLKQEIVLGIGGMRMLRALGYEDIGTYHMNEGHAAFLTLELLKERGYRDENVRPSCVFTTHTPIAAGHDMFDYDLAYRVVGEMLPWHIRQLAGEHKLSMTHLAMHLSRICFAVSRVHATVTHTLFPGESFDYVTNGIHAITWASPEIQQLFDSAVPGWRADPALLTSHCRDLPDDGLWAAHQAAKKRLIDHVNEHTLVPFDTSHLTIASARRVVSYKRPELLYTNLERLKEVCCGRVQIIHAGNAHPADSFGQDVIRRMIERSQKLKDCVKIVYLENYNPDLAKLLVAGADIWLNTPMRLHEASGTSGMKAALNGTINLSALDGWWIEGFEKDPQAGWRMGPLASALNPDDTRTMDAEDLYTQLQYSVIPEYYYKDRVRWLRRMKRSIGLAGHFNTHRVVKEYLLKAWRI